jgi:hypothetical protein
MRIYHEISIYMQNRNYLTQLTSVKRSSLVSMVLAVVKLCGSAVIVRRLVLCCEEPRRTLFCGQYVNLTSSSYELGGFGRYKPHSLCFFSVVSCYLNPFLFTHAVGVETVYGRRATSIIVGSFASRAWKNNSDTPNRPNCCVIFIGFK